MVEMGYRLIPFAILYNEYARGGPYKNSYVTPFSEPIV